MVRSSFSDHPLLRVSRPVSACSRCRAAKVKCDGKLPACTACEKAGRENECSAANDQFARGKERSYVAALELRIEKMERRLAFARSRKASLAQHASEPLPPVPEPDRKDSLAKIQAAMYRKAARTRENSDVNSLMSDFGFLSINATTRDFEPSTSNMTFARLVLAAATNSPVPRDDGNWQMPSRQTALSLIQFYMANIYCLYPAFSETALYSVLEQVYSVQDRLIKDTEYWLLYMVMAIGSSAQSQVCNDRYYIDGLYLVSRALAHADRALMPGYPTQIQSLILLTQYSTLDPAHFDSWHLIGFTCRAVIDLGFHQDPPSEQLPDKTLLDMRRKTFYCVYSLDRSISMVLTRAFSFTDAATNVAWPRPSSFSRRASITGQYLSGCEPALLLFQLRRAQSHWYQSLSQADSNPLPDASFAWQMCNQMREWAESLPNTLPMGMRELFDLEVRYSFVYCMSPSAKAPDLTDYGRLFIFEHALAYLTNIYEIAQGGRNPGFYSYHDALRVFFMGSQFVAVLRDAEDMILAGITPPPPPYAMDKARPPPLLPRMGGSAIDNLDRSIECLERTIGVLAKYGERWENSVLLKSTFETRSQDVSDRLRMRQQIRQQTTPPMGRDMRWVDVNVKAMSRNNGGGPRG
ncbi:fungal-specific transcription factor domain-containing protein [Xylariaceae sp. FL0594]|nr:fungal-specific transcription factor domain-containing protein [Xylariaceae sp. FL0594]